MGETFCQNLSLITRAASSALRDEIPGEVSSDEVCCNMRIPTGTNVISSRSMVAGSSTGEVSGGATGDWQFHWQFHLPLAAIPIDLHDGEYGGSAGLDLRLAIGIASTVSGNKIMGEASGETPCWTERLRTGSAWTALHGKTAVAVGTTRDLRFTACVRISAVDDVSGEGSATVPARDLRIDKCPCSRLVGEASGETFGWDLRFEADDVESPGVPGDDCGEAFGRYLRLAGGEMLGRGLGRTCDWRPSCDVSETDVD